MAATNSRDTPYALVIAAMLLAGCGPDYSPPRAFAAGEMVELVLTGHKAQIIYVNYCEKSERKPNIVCTYDIRVYAPQSRTDVSLLGPDGPISSYVLSRIDYVREYELRKATK